MTLLDTCDFSQPMEVNTRNGKRLIKKSPISSEFWEIYRDDKEYWRKVLAEVGISVGKFRDNWELSWWSDENLKFRQIIVNDKEEEIIEPKEEIVLPPLSNDSVLFEYQRTSVQLGVRSIEKYNRVLLGHSTGVGKTFCALGIARELGKRVAVVCPKPITTDWHRAAKIMGVDTYEVCGWEWVKTGKSKIGSWASDEKSRFDFALPEDVILVFDEVHRGKAAGTSQNAFLVRDSVTQDIQSIALSATIADDPTKLWAIGQYLGLHEGGKDYYRFLSKNGCSKTRFGFQYRGSNQILKRLHHDIYPERGNRLRHSDLGDQFPETLIKARAFDMDSAKAIASEYEELQGRIEELRMSENFSANVLAEQTRARQRIELHKAPAVCAMVRDLLEEGNSVFISVNYTETRKFIEQELKTTCSIYGGQSEMERRGNIDSFQRDQSHVIVGITQACREGLNLHDVTGQRPRVALIMPTPSAYDLKQVLGRVHRAGGKSKSVQYIVYAAGVFIEENICEKLDGKLKRMDLLADGEVDGTISLVPKETENA
jgi:superfamily II DNA or RNA helicase